MSEPAKSSAPFVPDWAERELYKPSAFDRAELDLLRMFYTRWEALHAITNDKHNHRRKEEAAQLLVDQAHTLRRLYAGDRPH